MKETTLSLPELALVAGTRVALGAGIGLVAAERLTGEQRRAVGVVLLLIGAVSTIPLGLEVLGRCQASGGQDASPEPG